MNAPRKRGRPKKSESQKIEKPRKRGRPRTSLQFERAKEIVQAEKLGSVAQYATWWWLNHPVGIPKRPDRTYLKEFTTWNDFLGNNNPFPIKTMRYRPFLEAKAFAQSLQISKREEWFEKYENNEVPKDIPKRPDLYYRKNSEEWVSWPNFLGVTMLSKVQTIKEMESIFFIIFNPKALPKYFKCGVTNGGPSSVNDFLIKTNGKLVLAYYVPKTFNHDKFLEEFDIYENYDYKSYYLIENLTPIISKLSIKYNKVKMQKD